MGGPRGMGAGAAAPFTGSRIREGGPEKKTLWKACVGRALTGLGVVQGWGQSPGVNLGAIAYQLSDLGQVTWPGS